MLKFTIARLMTLLSMTLLSMTLLSGLCWLTPVHADPLPVQPPVAKAAPLTPAIAPAPKADIGYLEGIVSMYQQIQASPNTPTNRAFKDVLDQLFQPNAVQIRFRSVETTGGERKVGYSGNLYFSQGQLFINYDQTQDDAAFATIDGKLYTWRIGAKDGEILKRFKGDTLAFLMYMIDPSAIMRSVYSEFLERPKQFTTTTTQGIQTLQMKENQGGIHGIQVATKPFWLKTLLFEKPAALGLLQGRLEIDPPIALDALPKELAVLPKGVKFKASEGDLRQRMQYL
jgi:hypothetical protein